MSDPIKDKIEWVHRQLDEDIAAIRSDLVEYIGGFSKELKDFKEETTQAIRVHRDTINNVSNLLSSEFFSFQKQMKDRLDLEKETRDKRQRFTDIKDYSILVVGCLVVILLCFLSIGVLLLVYLIYVSQGKV
jgi:hypothetical protein